MLKELIGRYIDLAALKHWFRLYSVYVYILIAGLPELLPQLIAMLPDALATPAAGVPVTRYMQMLAAAGLVVRFLRQKSVEAKLEAEARVAAEEKDETDSAGV